MKTFPSFSASVRFVFVLAGCAGLLGLQAQVNSGSDGHDGAFNPTTNIVINMADHPAGIYHYTSVNISNTVTVTFIPNANNTPVVWLVQSNVIINGSVDLSGQTPSSPCPFCTAGSGGAGGPGGWTGGNRASFGQGPGGGSFGTYGANASYGSLGDNNGAGDIAGPMYGNNFLIPLLGGSGGGGSTNYGAGGGGGGGAILIAASGTIQLNGGITASGGSSAFVYGGGPYYAAGGGSGGAVRLVASGIFGSGGISMSGGRGGSNGSGGAGLGRVRFDTYQNQFGGGINGVFTQGYQPIIIPAPGQGLQLTVTSVGGVPVSASPNGQLSTPDAILSAQQNNPIPIVVHCSNIPLNTQITVSVRPANAPAVSATGLNNSGTLSNSTATISITMPRGGGIIYATAAN
jgi:hypothetical protein